MLHDLDDHLRGLLCSGLLMLAFSGTVVAQEGTAPNGYYPAGYDGATFRGKVVLTTDDTISLNYVHGSKTDTFEAYATAPCNLPSTKTTTQPMPLSQVQTGAVITVFYEPKVTKIDGRKQKKNQVIGILFQESEWQEGKRGASSTLLLHPWTRQIGFHGIPAMSAHFIWPIREPFEKQVAGGLSRTGWRYGL